MRRVTSEQVLAAYQATGLRPRRHLTCDARDGLACPIGVLAYQAWDGRTVGGPRMVEEARQVLGLSHGYTMGFVDAVDGRPRHPTDFCAEPYYAEDPQAFEIEYGIGRGDGWACVAALGDQL